MARLLDWINNAFWRIWLVAVVIGVVAGALVYWLLSLL